MREKLQTALQNLIDSTGAEVKFELIRQPPENFSVRGEYSSNIALALAAKIQSTAVVVAEDLQHRLCLPGIECTAVNGFLNFRMNDEHLQSSLSRAVAEAGRYGADSSSHGALPSCRRVNIEFVSAEPTGPLHLHHGRIAILGDALCRLLAWQGADVTREYFLNDVESSSKMRLLGESVAAFYLQQFGRDEEPPEGALDDQFVKSVARTIAAREGNRFLLRPDAERVTAFTHEARDAAVENQKQTLRSLNVRFDVWTSESALFRDGRVTAMIARLQDAGYASEQNGALWLHSTAFGDETDRPLRRKSGEYTYLASDIAYHAYRFERHFDLLLNIWTSQHEQYLGRTHAALQAAGYPAQNLEVLICERTRLLRDGAPVEGEWTLDDALEEIEAENLRFSLLLADWNEPARLEIEVARRDDESNPAYAARLLPARLSTLLREATAKQQTNGQQETSDDSWTEEERQLARLVALWPDEAATATRERRPQRIARFILEMADATRQLLAASQPNRSTPVELLRAAHITAGNALRCLGIEPRDKF